LTGPIPDIAPEGRIIIMADENDEIAGAQFGEAMPLSETGEQDDAFADEELEGEEVGDEAEGSGEVD